MSTGWSPPAERPRRRRRARVLLALTFLVWWLLAVAAISSAAPASAHAELDHTVPASGVVLQSSPARVELTFSEPVNATLGRIVVMGPDGQPAQAGPATGDGTTVAAVPLKPGLTRGTYLVSYRVISADGHPVAGGFTFSVIAPSPLEDVVPAGTSDAPVRPWVRALVSVARYAGYAGIVLLTAATVLATALRRANLPVAGAWSLARQGFTVLGGGTALAIVVGVPYASGGGLSSITLSGLAAEVSTPVHQAHLARLGVLLGAWPLVRKVATGRALSRRERVGAAALALALFATWPLSGHAGTGALWPVTAAAGLVHVAAMALWLGGLVVLVRCLWPSPRPEPLRAVLSVWPRWAAAAVVAVVASGLLEGLIQTRSVVALTGTPYGRLVLAKVVGTAVVLAVAWRAHRIVGSWLGPGPGSVGNAGGGNAGGGNGADGAETGGGGTGNARLPVSVQVRATAPPVDGPVRGRRLGRLVVVELVVASVVVALATALVQVTPGRVAARTLAATGDLLVPPAPGEPVYAIERAGGLTLQTDFAPLQVGRNTMLMTLIDQAGQPVQAQSWAVELSMPREDIRSVSIPVDTTMGVGVAVALPTLPVPGDWTFTITARTSPFDVIVMHHSVRIY